MRLTVIGCGTAVPDAERVASGYLIETGGLRILLDAGPGVAHGLARAGADWAAIDVLCLTHFHYDHIGDVSALFFAWKYGTRPQRTRPLTFVGPEGTAALIGALPDPFGAHIREPGFAVRLDEVRGGERIVRGDAVIRVHPSMHMAGSVAYRVESAAGAIGYTGDTGPDDDLADFLHGVDVLLCECSVPDEEELPHHLTPTTAAAFARRAAPHRLVVTHVYPQLDRASLPERIAEQWPGPTVVAHDGLVLEI